MSLLDQITSQLGGGMVEKLGSMLGSDGKSTGKAVSAALPLLLGALARNSKSDEGAQSLSKALDKDHDGNILSDVAGFLGKGDTSPGQGILKHVFGGKQSRVESGISQASGMSGESTSKLLAMMAPVVMGALGKAKREQGVDTRGLSNMLDQERQAVEQKAPGEMGMLNSLLDADGDGDVDMGDIAKRGAGLLGKLFGR